MAFKHKVNAESEACVYLTDKWNNIKHEMVLNVCMCSFIEVHSLLYNHLPSLSVTNIHSKGRFVLPFMLISYLTEQ